MNAGKFRISVFFEAVPPLLCTFLLEVLKKKRPEYQASFSDSLLVDAYFRFTSFRVRLVSFPSVPQLIFTMYTPAETSERSNCWL